MDKIIEYYGKDGTKKSITISVNSNIDGYEIDENSDECVILRNIIEHMGLDFDMFELSKTAETYTTLKYMDHDLIRLRIDDKYNEIRLPIYNRDKYENDERFLNQENKNQHFWISTIHNMYDYEDVIEDAMEYILSGEMDKTPKYEPNEDEIGITGVLMNYLNIEDYRIEKNGKECTNVYLGDSVVVLFDIKCSKRSSWIRIRDTKNNKIDITNFNEDIIPDIAKQIEKEIKKRG